MIPVRCSLEVLYKIWQKPRIRCSKQDSIGRYDRHWFIYPRVKWTVRGIKNSINNDLTS